MEGAVKKALGTTLFKPTGRGGGGCISSGSSYLTDKGTVFVKVNGKPNALTMFEGEKASLESILSTGMIKCPKPIMIVKHGSAVALVMENLDMRSISGQEQEVLGEQLARMHLHNKMLLDKGRKDKDKEERVTRITSMSGGGEGNGSSEGIEKFGFHTKTCCGYLEQDNTWQADWTTFYIRQKLQPQVDMILNNKGDRDLNDIWPLCCQKIEEKLSQVKDIIPALVHGDLWSGNVAAADNQPVIFDPASFYGHSEHDFGIASMFGGFTSRFYNAYFKINPKTQGFEEREDIYELFHHLNHWNHFGSGYKGGTISLMKSISKL